MKSIIAVLALSAIGTIAGASNSVLCSKLTSSGSLNYRYKMDFVDEDTFKDLSGATVTIQKGTYPLLKVSHNPEYKNPREGVTNYTLLAYTKEASDNDQLSGVKYRVVHRSIRNGVVRKVNRPILDTTSYPEEIVFDESMDSYQYLTFPPGVYSDGGAPAAPRVHFEVCGPS